MKTSHLRSALNTGITFGILIIFLVLIGFTVIAAELTGDVLKLSSGPFGLTGGNGAHARLHGAAWYMGRRPRRGKSEPDTWGEAPPGGLLAGAVVGIMVGLLPAYLLGTLDAAGVKMSTLFRPAAAGFGQAVPAGPGSAAGRVDLCGLFHPDGDPGRACWRGVARAAWRQRLWDRAGGWFRSILEKPAVLKLRAHPAFRYVFYGLLLLIAFLLPLGIGQYWNYTLGTVGIYVLLGLGSNIVVGLAGLLDLGYVAFFAIGAYTVALLTAPQPHHLLWSFWIAVLPIGVLARRAGRDPAGHSRAAPARGLSRHRDPGLRRDHPHPEPQRPAIEFLRRSKGRAQRGRPNPLRKTIQQQH